MEKLDFNTELFKLVSVMFVNMVNRAPIRDKMIKNDILIAGYNSLDTMDLVTLDVLRPGGRSLDVIKATAAESLGADKATVAVVITTGKYAMIPNPDGEEISDEEAVQFVHDLVDSPNIEVKPAFIVSMESFGQCHLAVFRWDDEKQVADPLTSVVVSSHRESDALMTGLVPQPAPEGTLLC